MLGLLLIFFIGKYFYKLAEKFNQNKWLFAILGIVIYYVGIFIGGIILGILDEFLGIRMDWDNTFLLGVMMMPIGIGTTYLFYYLLKRKWETSIVIEKDEIQDIGNPLEDIERYN